MMRAARLATTPNKARAYKRRLSATDEFGAGQMQHVVDGYYKTPVYNKGTL